MPSPNAMCYAAFPKGACLPVRHNAQQQPAVRNPFQSLHAGHTKAQNAHMLRWGSGLCFSDGTKIQRYANSALPLTARQACRQLLSCASLLSMYQMYQMYQMYEQRVQIPFLPRSSHRRQACMRPMQCTMLATRLASLRMVPLWLNQSRLVGHRLSSSSRLCTALTACKMLPLM